MVDDAKYEAAVADYEGSFRVMDETLYRLCRENPSHADRSAVCAKLWIIGRTYATGIERKIQTTGAQGSSLSQLVEFFLAHAKNLDRLFGMLNTIASPLDPTKLRTIVEVHGQIVELLCDITHKRQSTRSFVSKYMHFHNPIVPIYDSVAVRALDQLLGWEDRFNLFSMPKAADEEYGWFTMIFFELFRLIEQQGFNTTVRLTDYYLLSVVDSVAAPDGDWTNASAPG